MSENLSGDSQALKALAVADSGFVFDPRTGHSYSLNGSGLALLRALQQGGSVPEVAANLHDQFDAPAGIEDDIESFLVSLRDFGLLAPRASGSLS